MTANSIPNYDANTGIHYGVIPAHVMGEAWYEESQPHYTPTCGYCGTPEPTMNDDDTATCVNDNCGQTFPQDQAYGDEPDSIAYEDSEYEMVQDSMGDVFVIRSPFFTFCRECSPCAPNAGYITGQTFNSTGLKTYCPGPEWIRDTDTTIIAIYSVETDQLVEYVNA